MPSTQPSAVAASPAAPPTSNGAAANGAPDRRYRHQPLVRDHFTADPSGHVFGGRLYIYASHDEPNDIPEDDLGSHFDMRDYHVYSLDEPVGPVTDHGVAFALEDVPWAARQLWAPDAAEKDGTFFFYFPAKDDDGVFRIGVAVGADPAGPFTPLPEPIAGAFSIDPAAFRDDDGEHYLYFGGIWGGQLQRWRDGTLAAEDSYPAPDEPALQPQVARLAADMVSLAEPARDVAILDADGSPLRASDIERRYFEGPWVFRRGDTYYLLYSTGESILLAYGTSDSPYGPFTYRGPLLLPVSGWTTQGSVFEWNSTWYLLYHDSQLSGQVKLRNIKIAPLEFAADGSITPVDPYTDGIGAG